MTALDRRSLLALGSAATLLPGTAAAAVEEAQARRIHAATLVIDPHADLPPDFASFDPALDGASQVDLPKLARGGVGALGFATFVLQGKRDPATTEAAWGTARAKLAVIRGVAEHYPTRAGLAASAADIRRIHGQGRVAILPTVLNGYPIGQDLTRIDWLYGQGVRVFGFVHAGHNDLADSSRPSLDEAKAEHGGLSALGRQAVARLNDRGVLIDVSQLSTDAYTQTLALTRAPVVASHSGVRALVDVPRNLSDAELDALKANGGVVHIVAFNRYLSPAPADFEVREAKIRARWGLKPVQPDRVVLSDAQIIQLYREINTLIPAIGVAALVDQVDYVIRRIGIDHVGIASDFNHGGGIRGWQNEGEAPAVTAELLRRGYAAAAVGKIWGGNFLRVLTAAEAVKAA